mmetsp:Transcript_8664/g.27482  ORF Transcript_8664/g.27482 Transcript_8664/m.27482 type:complete len:242 (+) Transcript_8664:227-952(+)
MVTCASTSTPASASIARAAVLNPPGPDTTTRHGWAICAHASATSGALSLARTTRAFGRPCSKPSASAASPAGAVGKGAAAAPPAAAGVSSRVQLRTPRTTALTATRSLPAPPSSLSRHQPASCGSRSASSSRHERTTSTGTCSWSRRGDEIPSCAVGARCARICGSATAPVPASSSSTLDGRNARPSDTSPGTRSVLCGSESQTRCGDAECSHAVAAPSAYTLMSISQRPCSHSFALLTGV